jgi:two-component system chemotaxis response regulator CheV
MDNFQKDIDDRANLTLSNRFELLLFRLGTSLNENKSELFGINVFKLREIVPMPEFTKPAGMKSPLMGMVNIRDQVIPVIDLAAVAGCKPTTGLNILLITEYARSVQAFAVESVENIMRLDWKQVHAAETAVSGRYITSIACLDEKTDTNDLAMVLDVEQILYDITPANHDLHATNLKTTKFISSRARSRLWRKIPKWRARCWRKVCRRWRSRRSCISPAKTRGKNWRAGRTGAG